MIPSPRNASSTPASRAIPRGFLPALGAFVMLGWLSPLTPAAPSAAPASEDPGFQSLFDGISLQGWNAPDRTWWSIEDGAITGRITKDRPCTTNQYLVWTGGELADFELKLESRLTGEGGINNGFQFRSRVLPDGDVAGYQMDNNLRTDWLVRLYDEFGRHTLAWRGKQTVFDTAGKAITEDLAEGSGPAWFKLEEWHEYHLTCLGPRIELRVNGRLAARVTDHDPRRADPQGALALQLHSGPPTQVQFRNIRLKILKPATPTVSPPRERRRSATLRDAAAHWDFGVGGHQLRNPLRYVGSLDDVEFNVRADGPRALPHARVALLRGGYFEAQNPLPNPVRAFTLYVRSRHPEGLWSGVIFDGLPPGAASGLRLSATAGTLQLDLRQGDRRVHAEAPLPAHPPAGWSDFVVRWDGETLHLILDGSRVSTVGWTEPSLSLATEWVRIGAEVVNGKASRAFHGELEEVGVWTRSLSDREVASLIRATRLRTHR
ncbi:MAG: DUF1080 domain-containing protein [Verrucomicrobiales bacterium]|nr:DUF1080 domain-containing protein [Verrucomicrobiales bacterium]